MCVRLNSCFLNLASQNFMEKHCPFSPLVVVFLVQCLIGCTVAQTSTNFNTDQSSLLVLKSQITSDPSYVLTNNWTTKTSVCAWTGVTCDPRHNRVTGLAIQNMGLEGSIPPEIGNLSFLVSLNMSGNFFHGDMPKEIGNLQRLKELWLGFNKLTGPIPPTIFNISSLEIISLPNNSLSGNLPVGICSHRLLKSLDLHLNTFYGEIPSSLGQCSQLEHLLLSYNRFLGQVPREIGNLTQLEELDLTNNYLNGMILPL